MVEAKSLSADNIKRQYLVAGSDEERALVSEFKRALAEDRTVLLETIAERKKWFKSKNLDEMGNELDSTNKLFNERMMLMAAMPLSRGLSPDALIQTVGMYAGMLAVSPAMRDMMKEKVCGACQKGIDIRMRLLENNEKMPDAVKAEKLNKWQGYRDRCAKAANGGRMPFTNESAAFAQLCIDKSAYLALREPDANYEEILEQHDNASEQLLTMCEADGLSRDDVLQAHRTMVGMMSDHSPEVERIYWDLAKGKVERSAPHEVTETRVDEFGNTTKVKDLVWTGEYVDSHGEPFDGQFSIRLPMSEGEYAKDMTSLLREQFESCKSGADVERLHSQISAALHTLADSRLTDPSRSDEVASQVSEYAQADGWSEANVAGFRSIMGLSHVYMADHPYEPRDEMQRQMCEVLTNIADIEFESYCCDHSDPVIEWENMHEGKRPVKDAYVEAEENFAESVEIVVAASTEMQPYEQEIGR